MLVGSVSGIYDRYGCNFGGIAGTAFKRVAHDDHVYIIGYHLDGVLESLTLALACVGCI